MWHERDLAEPARALIRLEHLAQHFLALRRLRFDDAAGLEAHRDIVDQRALIGQRLGARRHGPRPAAHVAS